ncbi:MAG: hypothetical protein P8Y37_07265 [Anaerolineales bacterium]
MIRETTLAAGQLMKSLWIADKHDLHRFESLQAYYTIAGRDLASGGCWFGARGLRWASVTNVREGMTPSDRHRSRYGLCYRG